jgi:hypothetical protein
MPEKITRIFYFLIISVLTLSHTACGGGEGDTVGGIGVATVMWTPSTTNVDGSHLDNLAGYKIYYGTVSRTYTNSITISNPGITSYVVENLPSGTYYFALTAFNNFGIESNMSNEVRKVINPDYR